MRHLAFKKALSIGLLALLTLTGAASAAGLDQSISQLDQQKALIKSANEQLKKLKDSQYQVLNSLARTQTAVQATQTRLTGLEGQATQTRAALATNQLQLAHLKTKLSQENQASGLLLRNVQEEGPEGYLAVLLGAHSFGDFLSRFDNLANFLQVDVSMLRRLHSDGQALAHTAQALNQQDQQLQATMTAVTATKSNLEVQVRANQQNYQQISQSVKARQEAINEMQAAAQQMEYVIQSLSSHGNGASIGNIHFIWPAHARITTPFGMEMDPVIHKYHLHTGIDIGVGEGTPIHAAAAGTVIVADYVNGYGNTVVIDHGDGVSTLYAHASKLLVSVGQQVTQGQVIDLAGHTGWATGPHLHFEIRINGKPVNPIPYLPPGP